MARDAKGEVVAMDAPTKDNILKAIGNCKAYLAHIEFLVKAASEPQQQKARMGCNICGDPLGEDSVVQASWLMAGGVGSVKPLVHKDCDVKERALLASGFLVPLDIWRPKRL